jgi:hypothetical protein
MESFAKMLAVARAEVSGHLDPHERVVAMGRCADITELFDIEQAGTARTLVVITNTKLRWVPRYNLDYEASLDLDRVTSFTERSHGHRFAIWMGHLELERRRILPDLSLPADLRDRLRREGRLREGSGPFLFTELAFSRADTAAAKALRESLVSRLS